MHSQRQALFVLSASVLALTAPELGAQTQTVVSPVAAATTEGSSSNSFPWVNTTIRRYLQVHSDIKGGVKLVNKLAWRRDGTATNGTGARIVDVELSMGESVEWDQATFVTSNNFLAAPTVVVPRQILNLGPLTGTTSPAPFEMAIPLTTAFLYTGVRSIAWEAKVFSNSLSGTFAAAVDAHGPGITPGVNPVVSGPGCVASGQTAAMTMTVSHADCAGLYNFGCYVERCPINAPVVLALGATNPSLSVPGLCGPLYTDLVAVIPVGLSSATGYLGNSDESSILRAAPSMVFAAQNTFPGAVLYLQAHAIDTGSTSLLPIANSDGKVVTVPASNTGSGVAKVTRVSNNGNGTLATQGIYFSTTSYGYGLVTEFSY